jgi:multicomponent Na+:H+ antiporter subunit E
MPPGVLRLSPVGTAHLASRFPQETLVAGIDVARRALAPRLSLRPGFITYPSPQPPGPAREAFLMLASLLPGTIPCDAIGDQDVLVHGVDVTRPIAAQMAEDEARFMRAIRGAMQDG